MVRDLMRIDEAEVGVDGDRGFGAQGVPDPADAQFFDAADALDVGEGLACSADQVGVDGVHETGADLADGGAEHAEDRDSDQQADDGVGLFPAEADSGGAEEDGEAGESVGAGVQPVGDQRG